MWQFKNKSRAPLSYPPQDDDYLEEEENEKPRRETSIWGFSPDYEYNAADECWDK